MATGRMAALAVFCLFAGTDMALAVCEVEFYNHNGSQMRAERCGPELSIYYDRPRSGIAQQGVAPGTLFFNGFISSDGQNQLIAGTARVFKRGCQPAEFSVEGYYVGNGGAGGEPIHLEGQAPSRKSGCATSGWRLEILDFN